MIKKHSPTQYKGFEAEKLACQFLSKQGLKLVRRNFYTCFGEIDLIMEDKNTVVFIEVRFRKGLQLVCPAESVDKRKQNKLIRTAHAYLQQFNTWKDCRLDVVAIATTENGYAINWIKNAFQVQ
jgi:putative endonuclease